MTRAVWCVALGLAVCAITLPAGPSGSGLVPRAAAGGGGAPATKTVTVSASSEGEVTATAERQNPGWEAVSARRVAPNDRQSRFWEVRMRKK